MRTWLYTCLALGTFATARLAGAAETLPVLKVNGHTYTNVTVTSVTATDIYFTFPGGMGNAKLRNLGPDLQKRFRFDPAKAGAAEKQHREADDRFRQEVIARKPAPPARSAHGPGAASGGEADVTAPQLHARSFRGGRPPPLTVEKWLTAPPDTQGKFVLVDFWATWCGPCRRSIPYLNSLQAKFADRLVVIGLSDEAEAHVRQMSSPAIGYAVAIDTQGRMKQAAEVQGIPHLILTDPAGIVRYEGLPGYLTEEALERLLKKYAR